MSQPQYSSPKIWGPHFWFMLRCIAYNYPLKPSLEDAEHIKIFFYELQYLLPCELCKYTFKQHFTKHPIDKALFNRTTLVEWVETIYQETKKVIQDKRIKILDITDEIDSVKPIKMFKISQKIDPLEEQLNEIRKNVMKKDQILNFSSQIQKIQESKEQSVLSSPKAPPIILPPAITLSSKSPSINQISNISQSKNQKTFGQKNDTINFHKQNKQSTKINKNNKLINITSEKITKINTDNSFNNFGKIATGKKINDRSNNNIAVSNKSDNNIIFTDKFHKKINNPEIILPKDPYSAQNIHNVKSTQSTQVINNYTRESENKINHFEIKPSKPYPPILNNLKNIIKTESIKKENNILGSSDKLYDSENSLFLSSTNNRPLPQNVFSTFYLGPRNNNKFIPAKHFTQKVDMKGLSLTRKCKKCEH